MAVVEDIDVAGGVYRHIGGIVQAIERQHGWAAWDGVCSKPALSSDFGALTVAERT
jgi:hypothetical protein